MTKKHILLNFFLRVASNLFHLQWHRNISTNTWTYIEYKHLQQTPIPHWGVNEHSPQYWPNDARGDQWRQRLRERVLTSDVLAYVGLMEDHDRSGVGVATLGCGFGSGAETLAMKTEEQLVSEISKVEITTARTFGRPGEDEIFARRYRRKHFPECQVVWPTNEASRGNTKHQQLSCLKV